MEHSEKVGIVDGCEMASFVGGCERFVGCGMLWVIEWLAMVEEGAGCENWQRGKQEHFWNNFLFIE